MVEVEAKSPEEAELAALKKLGLSVSDDYELDHIIGKSEIFKVL